MPEVVNVSFATQLLAMAVALQVVVLLGVLWRGIFGMAAKGGKRPLWLYLPLIAGTGLGAWYAVIQSDLVFGAAQGLALFIGVCLLRTPRFQPDADAPREPSRRERRAAKNAKKGASASGGKGNG
jgi:hypothetical protein